MPNSVLLVGNSYNNTDLLYKTKFLTSNPIIYLEHDGEPVLITATADWEQANEDSPVHEIVSFSKFNYVKQIKKTGHKDLAFLLMLKDILKYYTISDFSVPKDFPVFFASGLMKMGFNIHIDCGLFVQERSIKSKEEIDYIKGTQKALEKAMASAEEILKRSTIKDSYIFYNKRILTSKKLKKSIELTLLKENCQLFDIIVAGGKNSSNPHYFKDDNLKAHAPVMIDVFPFHSKNRYFADMTRTFIKGGGHYESHKMFESVIKAQKRAVGEVKAGASANHIYRTACDSFNEDGYYTLREQKPTEPMLKNGFIHSLGHGLGLDVHEPPFLFSQDIKLKAGNVITIEPGLYNTEIGGIRMEDLVLVTEESCEVLTQYHKTFNID